MGEQPKLNLVVIRSPDIERASSFYSLLGLEFRKHSHGSGPEHYVAEIGGFVFEIYPQTKNSNSTTGIRIGFGVPDVDSAVKALQDGGGKLLTAPQDSEWGRRAVIKDLDGHTVEITNT